MELELRKYVTADAIEKAIYRIDHETTSEVVIDITPFLGARLFAESRLLGLLSLVKRRGISIRLRIRTDLTDYGSLTDHEKHKKYRKLFNASLTGFILAQLADEIFDSRLQDYSSFIRQQQMKELERSKGLIHRGKELSAPIMDKYRRPTASDVVRQDNPKDFLSSFRSVLLDPLFYEDRVFNPSIYDNLREFAFEALQNTRDHGTTNLEGVDIESIRFISIRRLNLAQESFDALIGAEHTPINSYLNLLHQKLGDDSKERLVEVTIADGGIGIPARMARSTSIYESRIEDERDLLIKALQRTGTSKPTSIAEAGLGLVKVMEATKDLDGLIVFRTGRLCMYRHYLGEEARPPVLNLREWVSGSYSLMAGTSISLIFPWSQISRPSLSLFNE